MSDFFDDAFDFSSDLGIVNGQNPEFAGNLQISLNEVKASAQNGQHGNNFGQALHQAEHTVARGKKESQEAQCAAQWIAENRADTCREEDKPPSLITADQESTQAQEDKADE